MHQLVHLGSYAVHRCQYVRLSIPGRRRRHELKWGPNDCRSRSTLKAPHIVSSSADPSALSRDDSDAKRKAAAERQRDEEGHWRGRLGNLATGLMAAGHPAAIEVTTLLVGAKKVQSLPGFFEPALMEIYARLHVKQRDEGIKGHVAEVGVYLGKSFAPLALLRGPQESAVGIDTFAPYINGQGSKGRDNYALAKQNLCKCLHGQVSDDGLPERLALLVQPSKSLSHVDIRVTASRALPDGTSDLGVRIFSVDGCHSARGTTIDLRLAATSLQDGGIIILDDVFNPDWPEIQLGLAMFLENTTMAALRAGGDMKDDIVPFFIGYNKVMLCQLAFHAAYLDVVSSAPGFRKEATLFGSAVAVHPHGWLATFSANDRH